jgi:hypothetical protein
MVAGAPEEPLVPYSGISVGEALVVSLLELLPPATYTLVTPCTGNEISMQPLPAVVLLALRDVLCYSCTAKRAALQAGFHLQLLDSCGLLSEVLKHKGRLPDAEVRILGAVGASTAAGGKEQWPRTRSNGKATAAAAAGRVPVRRRAEWSSAAATAAGGGSGGGRGQGKKSGTVEVWRAGDEGGEDDGAVSAERNIGAGGGISSSNGGMKRIGPAAGDGGGVVGVGRKVDQQKQRWRIRPESGSSGKGGKDRAAQEDKDHGEDVRRSPAEARAVSTVVATAAVAASTKAGGDVKKLGCDQGAAVAGPREGVVPKSEAQALMKQAEGKLVLCCMLLQHLAYRDAEVKKELVEDGQVSLLSCKHFAA